MARLEASPSPVYGAALLMRLGFTPLPGSNPGASAARHPPRRFREGGSDTLHSPGLQFGLQLPSSKTPQRLVHTLARVLHLKRGHVGITLGCRHPGMAKNLLNYADMHPLRDQQRGGSMPGVVDSGIPDMWPPGDEGALAVNRGLAEPADQATYEGRSHRFPS
jgi:hypothetical protein